MDQASRVGTGDDFESDTHENTTSQDLS
jgi:hypothetical protein